MEPPAINPCGSCPYRRDVPSGIWDLEEYLKLPGYDLETGSQPVFLCHQQNGRICAGWCGTHDMKESLAIRFACLRETSETIEAIMNYRTNTPLFSSGRKACDHGLRELESPCSMAEQAISRLREKRRRNRGTV